MRLGTTGWGASADGFCHGLPALPNRQPATFRGYGAVRRRPLDGIEAAVTRLEPNGETDAALARKEAVDLADAGSTALQRNVVDKPYRALSTGNRYGRETAPEPGHDIVDHEA